MRRFLLVALVFAVIATSCGDSRERASTAEWSIHICATLEQMSTRLNAPTGAFATVVEDVRRETADNFAAIRPAEGTDNFHRTLADQFDQLFEARLDAFERVASGVDPTLLDVELAVLREKLDAGLDDAWATLPGGAIAALDASPGCKGQF